MNTKARFVLILTLVLLMGAAPWVTWTQPAPGAVPLAQGGAPAVVSYQGEVRVNDDPYTGNGYFKFAVVNAAGSTTYWSNDGTGTGGNEPTATVQLAVSDGLFSVLLGDTTLTGMTQALTADVFNQPNRYLRVWFSSDNITFNQLTPDTRIATVPYALQAQEAADADTVDGLHASQLVTHYQNVVVVAKSGGDYTSVQAAIDSITDAAADNVYLVWVAPGVYEEQVTMKPYVHLQGAGQKATIISSTASSVWPPTQATLVLASDASLRDLTVGNSGAGDSNAALLATAGVTRTLAADVTARALGGGVNNIAIFLRGSGTGVTLQQVTALAENGSERNFGLINYSGAAAMLHGGVFIARGGINNYALSNELTATMKAENVTALAENGNGENHGFSNVNNATAVIHGASFTGRGGTGARGVNNQGVGTTLEAESVTALAENGDTTNCGLGNGNSAEATLRGGSFTGRGGSVDAYGIGNADSGTTLEAEGVTALGENCTTYNFGLNSYNGAEATLRGGSFTGRGGQYAQGIGNSENGTTLEAEGITALAEDGSSENCGLLNHTNAEATLRGGAFTARTGVTNTHGIRNESILEAENVTALAENGSNLNSGLVNVNGAATTLRGGSFTARAGGGTYAYGICNSDSGTTLEAASVTALGANGSSENYGLYNFSGSATANVTQSVLEGATNSVVCSSGTITISNSRLAGNVVSGTVTCVLVTRGTNISTDGSTCP